MREVFRQIQCACIFGRGMAVSMAVMLVCSLQAQDNAPPVIVSPARDTSFECGVTTGLIDKLTSWYNNAGGAVATDDSGSFTWTADLTLAQTITAFNNSLDVLCGNKQKVTVIFRAVDPSGNMSAPTTATFQTTDTKGPRILNAVPNKQYNCIAGIRDTLIQWIKNRAGYQAADDCSNAVTWKNFNFAITANNVVIQTGGGTISSGPYPMIPDGICQWRMNISFVVADECDNETGTPGTTNFIVTDNVAPVFVNAPADITVSCTAVPAPAAVIAEDYCDKSVIPVMSESSSQSSNTTACGHYNYTVTRMWSVTDECGNSASHTQKITVRDNAAPVITGLDTILTSCRIFKSTPDSLYVSVSDNCSQTGVSFADSLVNSGCTTLLKRTYIATDACANISKFVQVLQIIQDTPPPITQMAVDKSFACSSQENFNAELALWLQDMGGSRATGACDTFMSFAAVKGSFVRDNPATWPGAAPVNLPPQSCPSALEGYLRFVQVEFVYHDQCGNASVSEATFGIRDNNPPEVTACPQAMTVTADDDQCEATILLPVPQSTDDCIEATSPVVRKVSKKTTSAGTGPEAIVDPLEIEIGPFNPYAANPLGPGQINIILRNMDIDDVTEYFNVYGEDNSFLGTTPVGAGQCATSSFSVIIDSMLVAEWIQDGFITLRFEPNIIPGSPVLSINNICSNSTIEASVSYEIDITNTVRSFYSVNEGERTAIIGMDTVVLTLPVGEHSVDFSFSDCALNTKHCIVPVTILDKTAPAITCPVDFETTLLSGVCTDTVTIPVNMVVQENCNGNRKYLRISPQSQEASLVSFIYEENILGYVARSKEITFGNVFPVRHWEGLVSLKVFFYGDNSDAGEQFDILGPGGFLIGRTTLGRQTDSCGLSVTEFLISATTFNNWISAGQVRFTAVPIGGGERINPCTALSPGQTVDGITTLKAELSYSDFLFTASVTGATTMAETQIPEGATEYTLVLHAGTNKVTIRTRDASDNSGTCQFDIRVMDREKPVAKCKNAVVTLDPSGLLPAVIDASLINAGSKDNCTIRKISVSPPSFDCTYANTDQQVRLIVEDEAGNKDSCQTTVRIKSAQLLPDYTSGLCSDDTLKLFANVPSASVPGTYSFHWKGPNGIEFFTENPSIPNADESYNGTYVLTVTGFNGCVSTGSVIVNIKPLTTPELSANLKEICQDQELILSSTAYSGNITYQWYEGIFPTGVLLRNSPTAEIILNPDVGVHFYYVIAKGPDCSSNPSSLLKVTVQATPQAVVNDAFLSICEGGQIILGTPVNNNNFTYHWTGPAGYAETGKTPRVITGASQIHAGDYFLTIRNGMCHSDTAVTKVVILERPPKPLLTGQDILCEGAIFTLTATSSPNTEKYEWYKDGILFTTTQDNNLIIPDANPALQGSWTVVTSSGNCKSEVSTAKFVAVDNSLEIGAINSGPVCMGDSVKLQVTFVPNATYEWEGPYSPIPPVFNPVIPGIPGDYSVTITTPTGCTNNAGTRVEVTEVPEITALSNDSRSCMQATDTIRFFPSVFPNNVALTFEWTGPNGFVSNGRNPIITGLNETKEGTYSLVIYNKNCPSEKAETDVSFHLIPATPGVGAPQFVCEGDTLRVTAVAAGNADSYEWSTPLGQLVTSTPDLIIYPVKQENEGSYTVQVLSDNCLSEASVTLALDVRPKPSMPIISGDTIVCFGDAVALSVDPVPGANYQWSGPFNPGNTHLLQVSSAGSNLTGSYTVTLDTDGCASESSALHPLAVKAEIKTPQFLTEAISLCKTNASGAEICMNPASLEPNATYHLYRSADNMQLASGTSSCFILTDLSGFADGTNFLYVKASNGGCYSEASANLVLSINTPPSIEARAVEDNIILCPGESARLISAFGPPLVNVEWSTAVFGIQISDKNAVSPLLSSIPQGENLVFLEYSVEGCKAFSVDTVRIYTEYPPVTMDDAYTLPYGQKGLLDVIQNDNVPQNSNLYLETNPAYGTIRTENGKVIYEPDPANLKPVEFVYRICADFCADLCSESKVSITFEDDIVCKAPNIITPNEDGYNDQFIIPCLDSGRFPANKVIIFNEWGDEVFYASPYRNDWAGTYGGKPLPAGTYFYILDTGDNQRPVNGFLILQR